MCLFAFFFEVAASFSSFFLSAAATTKQAKARARRKTTPRFERSSPLVCFLEVLLPRRSLPCVPAARQNETKTSPLFLWASKLHTHGLFPPRKRPSSLFFSVLFHTFFVAVSARTLFFFFFVCVFRQCRNGGPAPRSNKNDLGEFPLCRFVVFFSSRFSTANKKQTRATQKEARDALSPHLFSWLFFKGRETSKRKQEGQFPGVG